MKEKEINFVTQEGVIIEVTATSALVEIESRGACASCQLNGSCVGSESECKIVEVALTPYQHYQIGERVAVKMEHSMGFKAVWIAYVLPLILLILTMVILSTVGVNELYIAIVTIGVITLYYIGLSLFRNHLNKDFTFKIEKLDNRQ